MCGSLEGGAPVQKLRSLIFRLSAYRIALAIGFVFLVAEFYALGNGGDLPVFGRVENVLKDVKFKERGRIAPTGKVAIVAIDEKSVEKYGRFPWDRRIVADLVDRLTEQGVSAVAFDMTFSDLDSASRVAARHYGDMLRASALFSPRGEEVAKSLDDAKAALATASTADAEECKVALDAAATGGAAISNAVQLISALRLDQQRIFTEDAEGASDHALAEAIKRNGHVVMGVIGLSVGEASGMSDRQRADLAALVERGATEEPALLVKVDGAERFDPLPAAAALSGMRRYAAADSALPEIAAASAAFGLFNATPDRDGVIRRAPLLGSVGGKSLPSLELAAAAMALNSPTIAPYAATETGYIDEIELKEANYRVPVHAGAMTIDYYGPEGVIERVSAADLLDKTVAAHKLAGKLVFVAATAQGTFDQRVTPFNQFAAGVETHANAAENILEQRFIRSTLWTKAIELGFVIVLSVLFGFIFSTIKVVWSIPVMLVTGLGYHLVDYGLFRAGYDVTSFLPLAELATVWAGVTVFRYMTEEAAKRKLRGAFSLYLNPEVMEEMLGDPEALKLGGKEVDITVLFSDIRGFTTLSEKLTPQQLVGLLNEYLSPMTDLVFKYQGTLDKYIGDAVMAFFGAPVDRPTNPLLACQCALEMIATLNVLREVWRAKGYPDIQIGVGLNSGHMVAGNMGSLQRFNYTVMGDNVNLGSRLEGLTKEYGVKIIISEFTLSRAVKHGAIFTRELDLVAVKGKKEPVRIYELRGMGEIPESEQEWLLRWTEGLRLYRSQSWGQAAEAFRQAIALKRDDHTSEIFVKRCAEMKENPPGLDWDGVMKMTHK